jgi:uncharacterized membrane protein YukC
MGNNISIIVGATIGIILLLILIIITIIYYYKHSHYNQTKDSLHSVIINKHIRSISFINNDYHNNTTLLVSPRRLAILELQQQQEFNYENSSFDLNELTNSKTMRF